MLLEHALKWGILQLKNSPTPALDVKLILDFILGKNSLILPLDYTLSDEEKTKFQAFTGRRILSEPIAYILKEKGFYGLDFVVSTDVLIPRPDSEIIVETAINIASKFKEGCKIADLCTGSGALIISILANLENKFESVGIDISSKAVEIAKINQEKNLPNNCKLTFSEADILNENFNINADIIVSNPPYIPSHEIENLGKNVKNFEPRIALDGGTDGMKFYKQIALKCKSAKFIILEIGSGQKAQVCNIFEQEGFKFCNSFSDLSGIQRCLIFEGLK